VTGRCLEERGLRDWRHDWRSSSKFSLQLHGVRRGLNAVRAVRHAELDLVGTTRIMLVNRSDVVAMVTGRSGRTPAGMIQPGTKVRPNLIRRDGWLVPTNERDDNEGEVRISRDWLCVPGEDDDVDPGTTKGVIQSC
jgi:hypothetical protein